MKYNKIDNKDISFFVELLTPNYVYTSSDQLQKFSHDETEDLVFFPEVVLKPRDTLEVSEILKYCNKRCIPVTVCGARTGLSGGSLPVKGGVSLSSDCLNKIIKIDKRNLQAIVEPGVINQVFRDTIENEGLFFPPDPASKGSCFLGGNVAENAGGPKALKYGVTKNYVLNLEIVLPSGEIMWTGSNVLKNATGFDLTSLIVGSEGTLAIITKIVFRLIPLPTKNITLLVPFKSNTKACESVSAVFRAGITPSALEFIERDAIIWTINNTNIDMRIDDDIMAHLLIEVDGDDIDLLYKQCESIADVMSRFDCGDILMADSESEKNKLWKLRRSISESVKANSIYKEEDTVVPRAELARLLQGVKDIGKRYGFKTICYGHAGDGNLHINIIKGNMTDYDWNTKLDQGIREIFKLTKSLGGTISGEHGIGYVQKEYLNIVLDDTNIEIQKNIKQIFDPKNILNPGKVFPTTKS